MTTVVALEGLHALKHAVRFGAVIDRLLTDDRDKVLATLPSIAPELRPLLESRLEVVSRTVFRERATQPIPTHLLAYATPAAWTLADTYPTADQPSILLDDPRNSKNLGAVIRVGAASGAAGLMVHGLVNPFDPMAIRGAAGLQWALPCWSSANLLDELAQTGPSNLRPPLENDTPSPTGLTRPRLVGLDADGDTFDPAAFTGPTIFAFGSERTGLSTDVRERCDQIVSLPMRPQISSLNLATCVSAVLYLRLYATLDPTLPNTEM